MRIAKRLVQHHRNQRLLRDYLSRTAAPKLHVGCGRHILPGWLNADTYIQDPALPVYWFDASRSFPFADETFEYVFSEHMIEHISHAAGLRMLRECRRVLKPGGVLRVSTPDLDFLLDLRRPDKSPLQEAYIRWAAETNTPGIPDPTNVTFLINNFVRDWGHTFIYDEKTLVQSLRLAGFSDLRKCGLQESSVDCLRDLENEGRMPAGFLRLESMVFEVTK
ncbi:class I SAM-dependent methyltransferase [Reyranella sp.]|uniref:class I SAM-dependent methyltransferase n=1 Tax=Reyranella sp. TaxID=1929291 RepID=UPI003BAD3B63